MENSSDSLTLEVTIPENSVAGDRITVQCPGSNFVEFITPDNVEPGDTIHVMVANQSTESIPNVVAENKERGSYQGVAAVTTGVLVSALVVGPILTGIIVVGIVVCATQREKAKLKQEVEPSSIQLMEEATHTNDTENYQEVSESNPDSETREKKIASTFVKAADTVIEKWSEIDERFAISASTLKALATVQEMDERNKISETVVNKVRSFDEHYQVSGTATCVVVSTYTKAKELDDSCKLTENVSLAGTQFVTCVGDIERRYDVTTRITTALIFGISTFSDAIVTYINRIANGGAVTTATSAEVEGDVEASASTATFSSEPVMGEYSLGNEDSCIAPAAVVATEVAV